MLSINTLPLELSVGGAILLWGGDKLKDKMREVYPHDFSDDNIRNIVQIHIKNNFNQNVTLAKISENNDMKALYMKMLENVISSTVFADELNQLKDMRSKARIKEKVSELFFSLDENDLTPKRLNDVANEELNKINTSFNNAWLGDYEKTFGEPRIKAKCFLPRINKSTNGGFNFPSLVVVGASPSTGKTAFAIEQAEYSRKLGEKVLFFTLEMSREQITDRRIAVLEKIPYSAIDGGELSLEQQEIGRACIREMKKHENLTLIDDVYYVERMIEIIHQKKASVVIIDYLQIVSTYQKTQDERIKIDRILEQLKRCAKEANCCIVLLSQLRRATSTALPTMSDLKESGAIESNGDYILLMHRPAVFDPAQDEHSLKIIAGKVKFGKTGIINCYFDGEYQKITEIERIT